MTDQSIVDKMLRLAETHPRSSELAQRAQELDEAYTGKDVSIPTLLGAYARAKLLYSECSGQPLMPKTTTDTAARLALGLQQIRGRKAHFIILDEFED